VASRTAGLTVEIDTKIIGAVAVAGFAKSVVSAASDAWTPCSRPTPAR
jgi:hypothetical protein